MFRDGFRLKHYLLACSAALAMFSATDEAQAGKFKVLLSFVNSGPEGSWPTGSLVRDDKSGTLYGTTSYGGDSDCGVVFQLTPDGTETVLHTFAQNQNDVACQPWAGVIRDQTGNLFGTTLDSDNVYGGTVYRIAPDGTETVLHDFNYYTDGAWLYSTLIEDKRGNLYGTASGGGADGVGMVFRLAPDGTLKTLYSFTGLNGDGKFPYAGLTRDSNGNFLGTTSQGGTTGCNGTGCGTVFRISPKGKETILYTFQGGQDGGWPVAGVVLDAAGNIYGTADQAGANGFGTVFEIKTDGTESTLYAFKGGKDGANPGSLLIDSAGNLYGPTFLGGSSNCQGQGCGTIFKIAADGTETILHVFKGTDGATPVGALITDKKGRLYGAAGGGGPGNGGTIFRLSQ